jgi:hypothetical protein
VSPIDDNPALLEAIQSWCRDGQPGPLTRWFDLELGPSGVPTTVPVDRWWQVLHDIDTAHRLRPDGWPDELTARVERWLLAASRWSRPGGEPLLRQERPGPSTPGKATPSLMRRWASRCIDPGLDRLARDWFPEKGQEKRKGPSHAPPVASMGALDVSLAVLRPGWGPSGDILAIDHRFPNHGGTLLDLRARDRAVLAGTWPSPPGPALSRPRLWHAGVGGELYEWAIGPKARPSVRSVLLLADRGLALIAEQAPSGGAPSGCGPMELPLAPGVTAEPLEGRDNAPGLVARLRLPRGGSALAISIDPIAPLDLALPGLLRARTTPPPRSAWRAIVLVWGDALSRMTPVVRPLTVTERGQVCRPDQAVAVRLGWASEGLVIYRSIGPTGQRAVLGHPTTSRFLLGSFNRDGRLQPILKVDDDTDDPDG